MLEQSVSSTKIKTTGKRSKALPIKKAVVMLAQELTNHRRAARARAFADDESTSPPQSEALHGQVASLQETVSTLRREVDALKKELRALQASNVQALDPFVSVDPNAEIGVAGPNIIFRGANIHVVSGSGATDDGGTPRGLGNLIIGYDEDPSIFGTPLNPGDRGGSHNLVIGRYNKFTQATFGGLVAGEKNTISNTGASVSGGSGNTASGPVSSVSGGVNNTASGSGASISGGLVNSATGDNASVSGGNANAASGDQASVNGGIANTASGAFSSISGGSNNTASGEVASVNGGLGNAASGDSTVVLGGQNVVDDKNNSIAPQPPFP